MDRAASRGPRSRILKFQETMMTIDDAAHAAGRLKPGITLSADDYERLSVLAQAAMTNMPQLATELAAELERAQVLADGSTPQHTACMNGTVAFRDDTTGKVQTVTLVYPAEADILQGKVSVLTPVGTALIGLQAGQSISWHTPAGEPRQLTVLRAGTSA
jgi:regulator of nucleoside diphosphate kinase